METQFSQSGQFQKENFSGFIKELVQKFKPEQICSFGKNNRFLLATGLANAKECMTNQHFNLSTFMAHQVVEQCCIALIRVHLAYCSDIHNLYRQLRLCESFSPAPSRLFLSGSEEDKRLFVIMVKSYSGARYKDDFKVFLNILGFFT